MSRKNPGLFDEDFKFERISKLCDPLEKLNRTTDWNVFRYTLDKHLATEAKGPGGGPPFDYIMMFKILILQEYFGLSDEQMEFQITDRFSFMRFLGLRSYDKVPDSNTIWNFRENLKAGDVAKELFNRFGKEFNNAKQADYSHVTMNNHTCTNSAMPFTYHYNNWLLGKHKWNWWNVTANSRWTYTVLNGNINVSDFVTVTTALNTNVVLFFNDIIWTQGNISNTSINFNNSPNPKGVQIATGTIRIKSRIPTQLFGLLDSGNNSVQGTLHVNFHL